MNIMPNKEKNKQQYIFGLIINRYVLIVLGILLIGYLFWYFSQILSYVLIAWVLSMIGQPLMQLFQKIKIGKFKVNSTIAAGMTLSVYALTIALFVSLFAPMLANQVKNLAGIDYNAIVSSLQEPLQQLDSYADKYDLHIGDKTPSQQLTESLQSYFNPSGLTKSLGSIFGVAGDILIGVFSIAFITFFFLKESQLFTRTIQNLTPNSVNDKVTHIVKDSADMLSRYLSGILLQIFIITLGLFMGLSFLGVPNALLIAFLGALFNVIPYLGPLLGGSMGLFLTVTSHLDLEFYNEMLPLLGSVALVFSAMQLIDNFILQPFIFSRRANAHPLEIFIIVLVGAKVLGITGMVIAIPAYTIIRIIAKNFLSEFDVIKNITKGLDKK